MQTSHGELHSLCEEHDIVCLQETWLAKNELPLLSNINNNFIGNGISSIDDESQINVGRPFGGVGIMWRKQLNTCCKFKTYDCNRIIGLEIDTDNFSILVLCVYLPFDSSDNYDDFMFYLAKILQIVEEFRSPYVYVCGDFNANLKKPSRYGKELTKLCNDNSLSISDELLLPSDTFTFVSSSHASTSWLDHVLSTSTGHALVQSIHVKSDYVTSDHLPLCFTVCTGKTIVCPPASVCSTTDEILSFNWTDVTDNDIIKYNVCTKEDLSRIRIPLEALYCSEMSCSTHQADINNFYYDIVNTVQGCIRKCIPTRKLNRHSIVGWNNEVKHYHGIARTEFKFWKQNNMPRSGPVFRAMSSARARFKYALRQCRLDEQMISSDKLAYHMQCHDENRFWKEITIRNRSKSTLSNCIDGATGESNIANQWKDHYSSLLNSSSNTADKDDVCKSFKNMCFNQGMYVSVTEVMELLRELSSGKASGMDGLTGESLKYANHILPVLLSICFTCMFKHCYLPISMLDSVIVPLVKNRNGDLSDKNNYRPIALSSVISKVFENVILYRLEEYLWTTNNQFGYKAGHSTDLCVYALIEFIEYFKRRSTSVYVAFLDASKAFDKINHWILFKKLIARRVPIYLVKVLCFWYQNQSMYIKWGSTFSGKFHVTNGVRQGGVLSPLLFNVYVNELSDCLNKSGIGGSMNGTVINHMLYADDICIISLSSAGLQQLLNICSGYSELHDLTFNAKKSMCMYFSTSMNKHCGCPVIYLGNSICVFVKEVKYLGVMIHSSMKTTIDVARQTRKFYLQANLLLRNFRHCSDQVKCVLFQTYCTNLYCCQLWFNSTKSSLKKLSTSYNSVLRRLLGISKPYSASKMFVSRGIPTFAELLRTSIYRFAQRIEHSSNHIISATLLPLMHISSPIRKWWNCILYVK